MMLNCLTFRLLFLILFCLSIAPNSFAKEKLKTFNESLMKEIDKTKGNEHIYRQGRAPASVVVEGEEEHDENMGKPTQQDEWEEDHQQMIQNRNTHQQSIGHSKW